MRRARFPSTLNDKIDENLPTELAEDLSAAGVDVQTVFSEGLAGTPDPELLEIVARERRALFTMDKGVANTRRYPPRDYAGIVLLHPATTGRTAVREFVRRHLDDLLLMNLPGHLVVVTERALRVR